MRFPKWWTWLRYLWPRTEEDDVAEIPENLIHRPNRPALGPPDGIVVHAMGERVGGKPAREFLADIGVDAHRLIYPDGTVEQIIPDTTLAYHAGKSRLPGTSGLNSRSLGVELLVAGDHTLASLTASLRHPSVSPFTDRQQDALVECCRDWVERHPVRWILGHEHISGPWVRSDPKPDPGPWIEWPQLWADVLDFRLTMGRS